MQKKSFPWLLATITTSGVFVFLFFATYMHYALGDDMLIARSFAGYWGGVYETFHIFIHTVFAWLLHVISRFFPQTLWFSWLQLVLLFISQIVIIKSIVQLSKQTGYPTWIGMLGAIIFIFAFTVEYCTTITYTTTCAVLGAAAIFQLWSVDFSGKSSSILRGMLLSVCLLICNYSLRQISVLPSLAFWLLSLGAKWLLHKKAYQRVFPYSTVLKGCAMAVALFLLMIGIRAADIHFSGEKEFLQWQKARTDSVDYGAIAAADDDALKSIGWSESERELVMKWYFMDANISTEAFQTLAQKIQAVNDKRTIMDSLRSSNHTLQRLITKSPIVRDYFYLCLTLAGFGLVCISLLSTRSLSLTLIPLSFLVLLYGVLLYLAWKGRLPLRAAVTILLPCAAGLFSFAFSISSQEKNKKGWRQIPLILTLVLCLLCLWNAASTSFHFYYNPAAYWASQSLPGEETDAYVLTHPNTLFIADGTIPNDRRLFPDMQKGIPTNLIFWNWHVRSQGYRAQLNQFGMDADTFTVLHFLREDIRFITALEHPPEALVAYLEEAAGQPVKMERVDTFDNCHVFRFFLS